jgi:broad specificity phosphatase PhoE
VIYFVRHGETVWNRAGRLQGRADSPLTERGVAQARAYGEHLAGVLHEQSTLRLHSSPMGRARRSAALIAEVLGYPADRVVVAPLLAEHDVGSWTGKTWDEIERAHGDSPEQLRDWHHRPPSGETRAEMMQRAAAWLATRGSTGIDVVVSHGGMSRAFRAAYLGITSTAAAMLPTHTHGRLYRLDSGAVVELVTDPAEPPVERLLG